jgi:hypothetical protein
MLLVVVTLQGCKKQEENLIIKNYPGTSELLFNDAKTNRFRVRASFYKDNAKKVSISFLYAINDLYNREIFELAGVKLDSTNQQKIYIYDRGDVSVPFKPNRVMSTFSTLSDDGDVGCHLFQVLEKDSLNNWVRITKYNEKTKELSGEFSVTYIKTEECATFSYPDTIRIRNGVFHTKIIN